MRCPLLSSWLVASLAVMSVLSQTSKISGEENATEKSLSISVSIEIGRIDEVSLQDTLDIILSAPGLQLGGLDFEIGLESTALDILEILPGEIIDSCDWMVFNTRGSLARDGNGTPRAVWRILAMAEFGPDSVRATCFGMDRPASVARLVVKANTVQTGPMEDSLIELFFYWEDCTDNTITDASGDTLFIAGEQEGNHATRDAAPAEAAATRYLPPDSCINPRARNKPVKRIKFTNGGIVFSSSLRPDSDSE